MDGNDSEAIALHFFPALPVDGRQKEKENAAGTDQVSLILSYTRDFFFPSPNLYNGVYISSCHLLTN